MKNKIVIIMEGGLIRSIHSNIEVESDNMVVLDWDDVEIGEMTNEQMEKEVLEETKGLEVIL